MAACAYVDRSTRRSGSALRLALSTMDQARSDCRAGRHLEIFREGKKMRNGLGSSARWARHPRLWLASGAAAALVTAGLVVATANPASADPATTYVATGSDTTQDVMNPMAAIVGGGVFG